MERAELASPLPRLSPPPKPSRSSVRAIHLHEAQPYRSQSSDKGAMSSVRPQSAVKSAIEPREVIGIKHDSGWVAVPKCDLLGQISLVHCFEHVLCSVSHCQSPTGGEIWDVQRSRSLVVDLLGSKPEFFAASAAACQGRISEQNPQGATFGFGVVFRSGAGFPEGARSRNA